MNNEGLELLEAVRAHFSMPIMDVIEHTGMDRKKINRAVLTDLMSAGYAIKLNGMTLLHPAAVNLLLLPKVRKKMAGRKSDLAALCAVSPSMLSRIMSGERVASPESAELMSAETGTPASLWAEWGNQESALERRQSVAAWIRRKNDKHDK